LQQFGYARRRLNKTTASPEWSFRKTSWAEGKGYQTLINEALRLAIQPENAPITQETYGIIREGLQTA
jgi:hypothetical protein